MNHLDPDFKTLTFRQRELVLRSLYLLTRHSDLERPSGLTQLALIHAIGSSLLGIEMQLDDAHIDESSLESLQGEILDVPVSIRQRLFQLFTLVELVLDPLPPKATATLRFAAAVFNVEDKFIQVARDYSQGAYAIAASDLHRKGYLGNPALVRKGGEMMRCNKALLDPFEENTDDPQLLAQWQGLEHCSAGTLGREIWEYYMGRGFVFTGQQGSVNPTIAQHDWIHLLADYSTTIEGELEVFSFIGSAIPDVNGFSFLVAIVSLFETGRLESWGGGGLNADCGHLEIPGMPERLADAIRRGRICNRDVMYGIDYFDYKDLPIDEVRELMNIPVKDKKLHSPGVWHPEGITSYQREHGNPKFQPALN